jgi:hypothetical protein
MAGKRSQDEGAQLAYALAVTRATLEATAELERQVCGVVEYVPGGFGKRR